MQASDAAVAPQRDRGGGYWRDLDWILLIAAFALSLMGSLLVWSASRADLASESDPQSYLKRHLINIGVALALGFIASRINYRLLRAYTPVVYVASMVLLLVPFVPGLGVTIAGARAWIDVPLGLTIQPSEFAKITVILMMAALLSERRDREEEPSAQDVLLALAVAAIPTAIILVQNDTGTVLILAAVSLSIVAVSGVRTRWLVGLIGAAILGVLVSIQLGLLQEYQVDRLTSFINPDEDVSASAYNANQARIAIGGGGLDGYGLFEGPQTQGNFVPVNESDFIFTVAGEELGFLGSALLIALMAVILWRAVLIAWKADDLYGRLVATGVAAWLAFQMFENIGMTLGIMPITGIPLPFVSAGGTSMMATWIALGLLQTVRLHSLAVQRSEV
ncbi:MAG: rod shape-determining protein RodA [Actinomycetia bacterium]|nr:rod shape-determining protein RodA [Actinomycetes bacterium]MCH9706994.1 rod shape-determining protein RodA [Actinomycetes bacterium]MCH9787623.1 rod shape-determining protein RodA [Actinomycetes bacterium]MCH9796609.1 rod shape-determining protein RodA [Actinomycetes bacterium]MCH9850798.1 rod shape-determining protein RodA [Actinomycetes bacterium]